MKSVTISLLLVLLSGTNAATTGKGHPIERVIGLVKDLKAKSIAEGKDEAVAYEKFQYWCSTSTDTLNDAIADEKETIAELEDKLAGLKKQKDSLETEIKNLEDQIGDMQASRRKANKQRAKEAKLYDTANADLKSTIDAVSQCIAALEGAEGATEKLLLAQHNVKMVLSLISLKVTTGQRQVLESYAAQRPDQLAAGDKAAHVDKYDFKSENVIELLKQLKLKFEDDKLAGTKAETNAINGHDLSMSALDNAEEAATKSKNEKERELAQVEKDIADATKDLESTNNDLKADSKTLADTEDACRIKKSEWEARSKTREGEIEAMDQAVKILSKSSGVRTKAPENPVPPASPAFLQLSMTRGSANDPKMKAVALLKQAAMDTHSRALERLAVEVSAHLNGPFDQVNNMIEKMIFRLMDEQKKEDEHKHWCDQELKKTSVMKSEKEEKIKDLKAEINIEKASVQELVEDIKDANKMISDIDTFVKEATEVRNTGKKENSLAIKDAQTAQTSLADAIAVLTDFYKSSGEIPKEPWEFIQKPVNLPKNPATWGSEYTGVADPDKQPGGIVSVLEGVNADFAKMESETRAQEAQDEEEYGISMKDNAIEKAERTQEVKMKTAEKGRRVDKIASLSSTKKDTEGELEKTDQYIADLQKACVDGDSSYEDRKAARAKEIDALKTAQTTLLDAFKGKKFLQIKQHTQ